jgi:S-adenosyl-L-methionine hydrolase (adenosine-forming)
VDEGLFDIVVRHKERLRVLGDPRYLKQRAAMRDAGRGKRPPLVVLLTDFGADYYVGVMKGVVLSLAPTATIVDLKHDVARGSAVEAAFVLEAAFEWFPAHAVFCCVVDPGVGGPRRRVVAKLASGPTFVAPDNGLLSEVLRGRDAMIRELSNPAWIFGEESNTFQGRSRFAPAAARLSLGAHLSEAGPKVADPVLLRAPRRVVAEGAAEGEVAYVDAFGNLVTSLTEACAAAVGPKETIVVEIGGARIGGVVRTYADAPPGALLAYVGSTGRVEIAVRDGSAAERLGLAAGAVATLRRG